MSGAYLWHQEPTHPHPSPSPVANFLCDLVEVTSQLWASMCLTKKQSSRIIDIFRLSLMECQDSRRQCCPNLAVQVSIETHEKVKRSTEGHISREWRAGIRSPSFWSKSVMPYVGEPTTTPAPSHGVLTTAPRTMATPDKVLGRRS